MYFNSDSEGRFTEKFLNDIYLNKHCPVDKYLVITGIPNDYEDELAYHGMSLQSTINFMYSLGHNYVSHSHRGNTNCIDIVFTKS